MRRGSGSSFRPGAYRPPLGANAGTSRAPFRPPRRLDEPGPMPGISAADAGVGLPAAALPRGLGPTGPAQPEDAAAEPAQRQQAQPVDREPTLQRGAGAAVTVSHAEGASTALPGRRLAVMRARRRPISSMPAPLRPAEAENSGMAAAQSASQPPEHLQSADDNKEFAAGPEAGLTAAAADQGDGSVGAEDGTRRESRAWIMRVARESAGIQRAIQGSSSSSEQTLPSPHADPEKPNAPPTAQPFPYSQAAQTAALACAVAAAADEVEEGESRRRAEAESPTTERRKSREWVCQVAQKSAALRNALAEPSSSDEDAILGHALLTDLPAARMADWNAEAPVSAAIEHMEQEHDPGRTSVQSFCSMLEEGGPLLRDAGEGPVFEQRQDAPQDFSMPSMNEGAPAEGTMEQSDGPLAAWHELQENGCSTGAAVPSATSDRSIDIVGLSSQELMSQHKHLSGAAMLASFLPLKVVDVELDDPAERTAPEEVEEAQSDDGDIEIVFGSQPSQGKQGKQHAMEVANTAIGDEKAESEKRHKQAPPAEAPNQKTPSAAAEGQEEASALQLCLDLSLSSRHTDASANLQPQVLFASGKFQQSGSTPMDVPAISQAEDEQQNQLSQVMRMDLVAFRPREGPPTQQDLEESMLALGVPAIVHQPAFYGRPGDLPERPTGMRQLAHCADQVLKTSVMREMCGMPGLFFDDSLCMVAVWAGLEFKVPSGATSALPPFRAGTSAAGSSDANVRRARHGGLGSGARLQPGRVYAMTPVELPPSRAETDAWLAVENEARLVLERSQTSGLKSTPGVHRFLHTSSCALDKFSVLRKARNDM